MATASLRKDHELIEKVVKAMDSTVSLLKDGKTIPEPILDNVIDFAKNFTNVCHHGKEENSLFPALERVGMPRNMGPIAVMLMDHERTKELAEKIELSSKNYISLGDPARLISDMREYVEHVTEHLWKENNRLFMMAEVRLQGSSDDVDQSLEDVENLKLKELGKTREYYEKLVKELENKISEQ